MTPTPPSPAARLRAVKRHVWLGRHRFLATCAVGVEAWLADEVAALPGVGGTTRRTGGVAFEAPFDTAYAALLRLRVAESLRVYLLHDEAASTFAMLHDHLGRVRWPLWLPDASALTVRVKSTKSRLRDDAGLERTLRRAVRAQGLDDAADGAPPLLLHLHLHHDRASASLDLGGELHRRRGEKWVSPTTIRETTAAALCRWAGVATAEHDLVADPFCGSGSVVIEALELAAGAAPGRERGVPFVASPAWKPERFAHARRTHGGAGAVEGTPPMWASDADAEAVRAANHNLAAYGYGDRLRAARFRAQDLDLPALARRHGALRPLLLANPPYGKEAVALGRSPGALLRDLLRGAHGWGFALLYPRPEELDGHAGIEVQQVHSLVTGGLKNAVVVGRVRVGG
jgi:putative N6-adenine-specific DNA methylase